MPKKKKLEEPMVVKKRPGPTAEERAKIIEANKGKYVAVSEKAEGSHEHPTNLRHDRPREWLKQFGVEATTDGKVKTGITSASTQGRHEKVEEYVDFAADRHAKNPNSPYQGVGSTKWLNWVESQQKKIRRVTDKPPRPPVKPRRGKKNAQAAA